MEKFPRQIKEKVIRQWLQGTRRLTIAKDNGIGEGTVTNIIKDASLQEEYHDMELFRQLALVLNEKGLEPIVVGFSLRLLKIMENDGIDVNQVEPLISDFATYCFKHKISFDTLIQSGCKAFSLEKELGVSVKMLQEHIVRAKKTRDDLLDESQKRLRMMKDEQSENETIERKVEECKAKYPWIARNIDLEKELDEIKEKCKQYVLVINGSERKLSEIMRLEGANVELNSKLKTALHQLSVYQERLDKTKNDRTEDKRRSYRVIQNVAKFSPFYTYLLLTILIFFQQMMTYLLNLRWTEQPLSISLCHKITTSF